MSIEIIKAIILGVIEGITEFFPISSTGHLIIASKLLSCSSTNQVTFEIVIQIGAIAAVLCLYRHFFLTLLHPKNWVKKELRVIGISILPVLILGYFCHNSIKTLLFSPYMVVIGLIFGSLCMILVEKGLKIKEKTNQISEISYKQGVIIGICQCFALWPGTSRSGATIVGGILSGLSYELAAKFSFIIAVPVMIIATGYEFIQSMHLLTSTDYLLMGVGTIVSFGVGYYAMIWLIKLINRYKLFPFACYRLILAGLTLWVIS